jgi:hypothetical protein
MGLNTVAAWRLKGANSPASARDACTQPGTEHKQCRWLRDRRHFDRNGCRFDDGIKRLSGGVT